MRVRGSASARLGAALSALGLLAACGGEVGGDPAETGGTAVAMGGQTSGGTASGGTAGCPTGTAWCGASCVDLSTEDANCGACGHVCPAPTVCQSAECHDPACQAARYADCDEDPLGTCETNVAEDPNHCGGCGVVCSSGGGTPSCVDGKCQITCTPGYADCNRSVADGCEAELLRSLVNCGSCGHACSCASGTGSCNNGTCSCPCSPLYADCDGSAATGCETNIMSSVQNCGSCGHACTAAHGTPSCVLGECGVGNCDPGYGDCNGNPSDGCEADLAADPLNCGSCGHACGTCASGDRAACGGIDCVCSD